MKNKISIFISTLIVVAAFAYLAFYSYEKIHAKMLEDIEVVNHMTIYAKEGYPVYTKKLELNNEAYFITDISLEMSTNIKNRYFALVPQEKAKTLKAGNIVYIPKNKDVLEAGFSWKDSGQYNLGKIVSISKDADWKTGFYKVNIQIDEALEKQPFYSAKVVKAKKKNIVTVSIANLDNIDGKYYAWLEDENSKAIQMRIKTGICDGYNCEVVSGIQAGDTIITSDRKLLTEGMLLNNRGESK